LGDQRTVALNITLPWKKRLRAASFACRNRLIQLHTLIARLFHRYINSLQIMCRVCAATVASVKGFA
jgi:hypothetical protein